ncbi:MAG TPA: RNA methyltransferase [Pyrinomonadaceae bacterium]|nr:RNA methyltransferase [Pyrinomonadaceae bacterium]
MQKGAMAVKKIESRDNPRLKYARKVRDRRVAEQIFVEGYRLVEEAVKSGLAVESCFCAADFADTERKRNLLNSITRLSDDIFELPERLFASLADTKTSQGIVLICGRPKTDLTSFKRNESLTSTALPTFVMLHEVNNPANVGAVVRTAEAAGATGIILTQNSTDVFSPKALRASMGSAFRLPIWQDGNLKDVFDWAAKENLLISAAAGNGEASYTKVDWTRPRLLIFGSEAHGLGGEVLKFVKTTVQIPIQKPVESLNLAVSAGIILFEARRQNELKG